MKISHWSKSHWTTLFSVALDYPEEPRINDQFHYKRYYTEIQYVLPCETCRKHYRQILKKIPINPYLRGGRKSLFLWVLKVHNMINEDVGSAPLTAGQVVRKYFPNMKEHEAGMLGIDVGDGLPQVGGASNARVDGSALLMNLALVGVGLAGVVGVGLAWRKFGPKL